MYSGTTLVCMCDYHYLVAAVDQLRRQLVDVTFDSSRLREEEVTDHGDVVRHLDESDTCCFVFDIVNASIKQDDYSKDLSQYALLLGGEGNRKTERVKPKTPERLSRLWGSLRS